jgi:hypothetical protein
MSIRYGGKRIMDFKECPRCLTICDIVTISSYDLDGSKLGGIFKCRKCGWFDFDNFISPEDIRKYTMNGDKLGN